MKRGEGLPRDKGQVLLRHSTEHSRYFAKECTMHALLMLQIYAFKKRLKENFSSHIFCRRVEIVLISFCHGCNINLNPDCS